MGGLNLGSDIHSKICLGDIYLFSPLRNYDAYKHVWKLFCCPTSTRAADRGSQSVNQTSQRLNGVDACSTEELCSLTMGTHSPDTFSLILVGFKLCLVISIFCYSDTHYSLSIFLYSCLGTFPCFVYY